VPFHAPVLRDRVVAHLVPAAPGLLVDATVGLAGHAGALLQAAAGFVLLGLDRDPSALRHAGSRLQPFGDRVSLVNCTFSEMPRVLVETGSPPPVAILADLGCSSLQLDSPERGFSFQHDGPLDMRMSTTGRTAAELVNEASEEELMRILWDYGEERRARAITRAILKRRADRPLATTAELTSVVLEVLGPKRGPQIHPATRTFQALRIAVNDELGELERFVEPAARCLEPGGRLAIISFHSLEDRLVKWKFKENPFLDVLTKKPVTPTLKEIRTNPRARSAKLRAAYLKTNDK